MIEEDFMIEENFVIKGDSSKNRRELNAINVGFG